MKKHLFLFTVITLWLFVQSSFSQDLNMLKNAPFIFKGKVVTYRAFRSNIRSEYTNNTLYASYIIDITAIYKGENELTLGTVEIITKAPDTWALTEDGSTLLTGSDDSYYPNGHKYPLEFGGGETGVFFCNKNNVFSSHIKCNMPYGWGTYATTDVKTDNAVILEPICKTMNCLFYYYNEHKFINENRTIEVTKIDGFGKKFDSEEELMEYLKKESIISSAQIIKKKDAEEIINT